MSQANSPGLCAFASDSPFEGRSQGTGIARGRREGGREGGKEGRKGKKGGSSENDRGLGVRGVQIIEGGSRE